MQIVETLRRFTDEDNRLSEREFIDKIWWYNSILHGNSTEIAKTKLKNIAKNIAETCTSVSAITMLSFEW